MEKKLTAAIIDDEAPARDIIKTYLGEFPNIEIAAECRNGFEGIKAIHEINPDIVFLDIQMPKISGFEMLELLDNEPVIIFTTAFDQYAVKAFEVNAADYLLKPFSRERFGESIVKARGLLKDKSKQREVMDKLMRHHDSNMDYLERIVIKSGSRIKIIPAESVFWIEAQDDYVMIHSQEGKFLKQKTMKFFEQHLNARDFIRIHRSHIVRISHIKQIEPFSKTTYQAILTNGTSLPLSKTGYRKIKDII